MDIAILIPSMNPYLARYAVESIINNSEDEHDIVLYNNTEDKTFNDSFPPHITIIPDEPTGNIGLPRAYAEMRKQTNRDFLFIADDDFVFLPRWDRNLKYYLRKSREMGLKHFARAPVLIEAIKTKRKDYVINYDVGKDPATFNEKKIVDTSLPLLDEKPNPYWAHVVSAEAWDELDGWDADFFPGFGADPDFLYRLYCKYGPKSILNAPKSLIYHFVSRTSGGMPKSYYAESHRLFLAKHGCSIQQATRMMARGEKIGDGDDTTI